MFYLTTSSKMLLKGVLIVNRTCHHLSTKSTHTSVVLTRIVNTTMLYFYTHLFNSKVSIIVDNLIILYKTNRLADINLHNTKTVIRANIKKRSWLAIGTQMLHGTSI